MRVVIRVYKDARTKPHHDEYKTDCEDQFSVDDVVEDIRSFLERSQSEIEDDYESDEEG